MSAPIDPDRRSSHPDSYSGGQRALAKIVRPLLMRLATPILRVLAHFGVAPNLLSLLQIPFGGLMVIAIGYQRALVIPLLLICFALDGLDGLLARYTNQTSRYGALIDQMADQIREVLTVAAVAQVGALSPAAAVLYGVLYPVSNVGLYLVNSQGGTIAPTFKSAITFYPFLLIYLLGVGGANWLELGGWLTVITMSATIAQCARSLAVLGY